MRKKQIHVLSEFRNFQRYMMVPYSNKKRNVFNTSSLFFIPDIRIAVFMQNIEIQILNTLSHLICFFIEVKKGIN